MPLRVMGYDGAEYRAQLLGDNDTGSRYPVVTLVLYFGHEKPWSGPLSLKERLNVPKEFEPYVNDYKINLFQIAYLNREQVELFQSDFKVVADYFVQKRENGDYVPSSQDLTHVQETLQLLSIMTNDHRFEDAYNTSTDETVVLLSKGEIDSKKVRVEFSLEDMDMSGFQKGATYEQIKAYVLEHTGLKVSSLYISQIKRKCGLDVGQNYNLSKKEDAKVPKCPPEKEAAIRDALKYFQMI